MSLNQIAVLMDLSTLFLFLFINYHYKIFNLLMTLLYYILLLNHGAILSFFIFYFLSMLMRVFLYFLFLF